MRTDSGLLEKKDNRSPNWPKPPDFPRARFPAAFKNISDKHPNRNSRRSRCNRVKCDALILSTTEPYSKSNPELPYEKDIDRLFFPFRQYLSDCRANPKTRRRRSVRYSACQSLSGKLQCLRRSSEKGNRGRLSTGSEKQTYSKESLFGIIKSEPRTKNLPTGFFESASNNIFSEVKK